MLLLYTGAKSQDIYKMILKEDLNLSPARFPRTTPQAFDFLRKMLTKDPAKRISLSEALIHPFIACADSFTGSSESVKHEASADVVRPVFLYEILYQ